MKNPSCPTAKAIAEGLDHLGFNDFNPVDYGCQMCLDGLHWKEGKFKEGCIVCGRTRKK